MKNSTEYINYQDPLTVAKALEKAAQIREAKQIEEQKRIESMATHEEFAKDDTSNLSKLIFNRKSCRSYWN